MEDDKRFLESIIERVKLSPFSEIGTIPPASIMARYYEESKKNGSWPKVIKLLKAVWERELLRILNTAPSESSGMSSRRKDDFGDIFSIPLIEVYIQDNKPIEADEIFNSVLNSGGKFADISKIVELAKTKGHETLAKEWARKVQK